MVFPQDRLGFGIGAFILVAIAFAASAVVTSYYGRNDWTVIVTCTGALVVILPQALIMLHAMENTNRRMDSLDDAVVELLGSTPASTGSMNLAMLMEKARPQLTVLGRRVSSGDVTGAITAVVGLQLFALFGLNWLVDE